MEGGDNQEEIEGEALGPCSEARREICILSLCRNGAGGRCANVMYEEEMERRMRKYMELASDPEIAVLDIERYGRDELMKSIGFSTGGMRGIMRSGFSGINEVTCNLLGTELCRRYGSIVIGCDGRYNSLNYAVLLKEIFEAGGKKAYLHVEVATPFLSFLVHRLRVEVGIMVTASHNPKEYNGFKVYSPDGSQIRPPLDKEIEDSLCRFEVTRLADGERDEEIMKRIRRENLALNGKVQRPVRDIAGFVSVDRTERSRLIDEYNESMFRRWDGRLVEKIRTTGASVPVVFTGLCGVSGEFVKRALEFYNLDRTAYFVDAECTPDPEFPGLEFPNPELDESLKRARESGLADIVFSCDPDGDRFGLSEKIDGEWTSYNGNEIAGMFMDFFVSNFDPSTLAFVNTFLCDSLMERVSASHGIEYLRTETGFKNVSKAVDTVREKNILAYEDSLGFLFGDGMEKDGIKCVVLMMYLVQNRLPSEIRRSMRRYGEVSSVNRHIRSDDPQKLLDAVLQRIPDVKTEGKRNTIEFDDHKVILRVSGTEPVLKIYANSESLDKSGLVRAVDEFVVTYICCGNHKL